MEIRSWILDLGSWTLDPVLNPVRRRETWILDPASWVRGPGSPGRRTKSRKIKKVQKSAKDFGENTSAFDKRDSPDNGPKDLRHENHGACVLPHEKGLDPQNKISVNVMS